MKEKLPQSIGETETDEQVMEHSGWLVCTVGIEVPQPEVHFVMSLLRVVKMWVTTTD